MYHKGYKAHYARYLKKKMTQAEFQKWADYAIELRNKALEGEIEYDEYVREMKKRHTPYLKIYETYCKSLDFVV